MHAGTCMYPCMQVRHINREYGFLEECRRRLGAAAGFEVRRSWGSTRSALGPLALSLLQQTLPKWHWSWGPCNRPNSV